ncbi:MAG TPA: biopolymer transporter ExbD [Phycisphaerae bacterium]|nr:biopolymer transporter ExbD [Phycisphaerae bacterium]
MTDPQARRRQRGAPGFNMTPMIDVVFLLIIFFMLVSQFASAENVPMDLPKPEQSQAVKTKLTDRVVVNCLLATPSAPDTSGVAYSVGPLRVASLDELSARLAAAKAANPRLQVVIRADRRLPYRAVHVVMEVVARHRIEVMNLVAHVGEGGR